MKKFVVFFLIVILAFQWMGSLFTISFLDAIVVKTTMTVKEKLLANHLQDKYNLSINSSIYEIDPASYVRMGYGAPFIFSEEISGETTNFVINQEESNLLLQVSELSLADLQNSTNPHMFYSFYPTFLPFQGAIRLREPQSLNIAHLSIYTEFYESIDSSITLPPPIFKV